MILIDHLDADEMVSGIRQGFPRAQLILVRLKGIRKREGISDDYDNDKPEPWFLHLAIRFDAVSHVHKGATTETLAMAENWSVDLIVFRSLPRSWLQQLIQADSYLGLIKKSAIPVLAWRPKKFGKVRTSDKSSFDLPSF